MLGAMAPDGAAGDGRQADDELARAVLPRLEDLTGPGWAPETEDGDGEDDDEGRWPIAGLAAGFPDDAVTAGAEVTFRRGVGDPEAPGIVHAMATVFDRAEAARAGWLVVADEDFALSFAESVARAATGTSAVELLGPVAPPPVVGLDRSGRRAATHRATWSRVESGGLVPVTLDLAALAAGRALVVLWSIDGDAAGAGAAWERLVDRASLRCEAALAS
jgi:hypothetical protein